ncbi:MAG: DUF1294 domain-containing protein [Clostridia bacterium]|nr:DUF1294 domain-containing protein [Clostridia bacterium]
MLIIYNIFTFFVFGIDKLFAVKKRWRISEKALLLFSLLFGATGGILGMIVFCHKTRKPKFRVLMPIFYIFNIIVIFYLLKNELIPI